MSKAESALIALVPEAEALVAPFRRRFDPSAALGVPAHITVLYPFRPPDRLDGQTLETLGQCFADIPAIDFALTALCRFGSETLYLAPDPEAPFRDLTLAVWRLFPETPPYGGEWPDIVPHLSIAHSAQGADLDRVADEIGGKLGGCLPVKARISAVTLIENTTGRWTPRATFPLDP